MARRYRDLAGRVGREETGLAAVEGIRLVAEALTSNLELPDLYLSQDLGEAEARRLLALAEARKRPPAVHRLPPDLFQRMAHTLHPQGAAAVVGIPPPTDPGRALREWRFSGVLFSPADPGNLGTILRTAEAAGADGLVVVEPACDHWNPKAVRASMGSVFRLPVARFPSPGDFLRALRDFRGTVLTARPRAAASLYDLRPLPPLLVVFGSEAGGLPPAVATGEVSFGIPMAGSVESLNLALAAGIALFQLGRRLVPPGQPGEAAAGSPNPTGGDPWT
jgi:TrmH family RNA methyltransferase